MAELSDYSLLKGLQNLLKTAPTSENSDSEGDDQAKCPVSASPSTEKFEEVVPSTTATIVHRNQPTEYPNLGEDADVYNCDQDLWHLPAPEYEFVYKQRVNTEDVYLQMGNKTPASASCEDLIVRIRMPREMSINMAQMKLDITETFVHLKTKEYQLKLPLPHLVDPDQGSAQWDGDKKVLSVVLRLRREWDLVNF